MEKTYYRDRALGVAIGPLLVLVSQAIMFREIPALVILELVLAALLVVSLVASLVRPIVRVSDDTLYLQFNPFRRARAIPLRNIRDVSVERIRMNPTAVRLRLPSGETISLAGVRRSQSVNLAATLKNRIAHASSDGQAYGLAAGQKLYVFGTPEPSLQIPPLPNDDSISDHIDDSDAIFATLRKPDDAVSFVETLQNATSPKGSCWTLLNERNGIDLGSLVKKMGSVGLVPAERISLEPGWALMRFDQEHGIG